MVTPKKCNIDCKNGVCDPRHGTCFCWTGWREDKDGACTIKVGGVGCPYPCFDRYLTYGPFVDFSDPEYPVVTCGDKTEHRANEYKRNIIKELRAAGWVRKDKQPVETFMMNRRPCKNKNCDNVYMFMGLLLVIAVGIIIYLAVMLQRKRRR